MSTDRHNPWQNVQVGRTGEQVRLSLGRPTAVLSDRGGLVVWKYGRWPNEGTLTLRDGVVVNCQKPPLCCAEPVAQH